MSDLPTSASTAPGERPRFIDLLQQQVQMELGAQQQYLAIAIWFDGNDLPRLAAHFYRQAVEERNHAMMLVRYMLDRNHPVAIPGVDEVRNEFTSVLEPLQLALQQEKDVTDRIESLFRTAREEGDFLGEQFMLWFLKEQVEEVAAMSTLVAIAERAGSDWFQIEDFMVREKVGDEGADTGAPEAAGGAL